VAPLWLWLLFSRYFFRQKRRYLFAASAVISSISATGAAITAIGIERMLYTRHIPIFESPVLYVQLFAFLYFAMFSSSVVPDFVSFLKTRRIFDRYELPPPPKVRVLLIMLDMVLSLVIGVVWMSIFFGIAVLVRQNLGASSRSIFGMTVKLDEIVVLVGGVGVFPLITVLAPSVVLTAVFFYAWIAKLMIKLFWRWIATFRRSLNFDGKPFQSIGVMLFPVAGVLGAIAGYVLIP
jgi:hypothetical protein